jgi:hypothetical protein
MLIWTLQGFEGYRKYNKGKEVKTKMQLPMESETTSELEELLNLESWLLHYAALTDGSNTMLPQQQLREAYLLDARYSYLEIALASRAELEESNYH